MTKSVDTSMQKDERPGMRKRTKHPRYLRITEEQHRRIVALAEKQNRTITAVAERALVAGLKAEEEGGR